MLTEDAWAGCGPLPSETREYRMSAAILRLAARWDRIADEHGNRQFTGNDHRLFANELRAALTAALAGD